MKLTDANGEPRKGIEVQFYKGILRNIFLEADIRNVNWAMDVLLIPARFREHEIKSAETIRDLMLAGF